MLIYLSHGIFLIGFYVIVIAIVFIWIYVTNFFRDFLSKILYSQIDLYYIFCLLLGLENTLLLRDRKFISIIV